MAATHGAAMYGQFRHVGSMSSAAGSPNASQVQLSAPSVELELLEKPRGSNGQWIPLHADQYVRVSSKKGKNLRLVARTNPATALDWDKARICAVENTAAGVQRKYEPSETSSHVQILDSRWSEGYAEFDIKIFFKNNTVYFVLEVADRSIKASSGAIITHNSGHIDQGAKKASTSKAPRRASQSNIPIKQELLSEGRKVSDSDESLDGHFSMSPTVSSPGSCGPDSPHSPQSPTSPKRSLSSWITIEKSNLDVQGDVRARRFLQYSDLQLKTDISDILGALQFVTQLSGKKYYWKSFEPESASRSLDRRQFVLGFIAQEVQRVLPELVEKTEEGFLAVKYSEFVPILIEALKQHAREVDTWTARVDAISKEFDTSHRILLEDLRSLSSQLAIPRGSSSTSTTSTSCSDPGDSDDSDADLKSIQSPRVFSRVNIETSSPSAVSSKPATPVIKRATPKRYAKPVMMPVSNDEDNDAADEASDAVSLPEIVRGTSNPERSLATPAKLDPDRMFPFESQKHQPNKISAEDEHASKHSDLPSKDQRSTKARSPFRNLSKARTSTKQQNEPATLGSPPMSRLKKGLIIVAIITAILALTATGLAVYFLVWAKPSGDALPNLPPVNPISWKERNIAQNSGFEDDPSTEDREVAYWDGNYIRTRYDSVRKRASQPESWPLVSNASLYFDSGKWGARMTIQAPNVTLNESLIYPTKFAAQVVNMTYFGLQLTGGAVNETTRMPDPTHFVCGMNVSTWFSWAYSAPLNQTNPGLLNSSYDWTNQTRPRVRVEVMTLKTAQGYVLPSLRYNTSVIDVDLVNGNLTSWDWHQLRIVVPIRYQQWPRFLAVRMSSTMIGSIFFDLVEARIVPCTFFDPILGVTSSSEIS